MITQEYLKQLLTYSPKTGVFTWKSRELSLFKNEIIGKCWNSTHANTEAGTCWRYRSIRINRKSFLAHRLAWFYVHGEWPEFIDHINGNGLDNRISNLRAVTKAENSKNIKLKSDNKSGVHGVCWHSRENKWKACIHHNNKKIHLGTFLSLDDAIKARKEAEKTYKYHNNHGRISNGE